MYIKIDVQRATYPQLVSRLMQAGQLTMSSVLAMNIKYSLVCKSSIRFIDIINEPLMDISHED